MQKDIIIIVNNQLRFVKSCLESIFANTKEYNLYVWDNGSTEPTAGYLKNLNINLHINPSNEGFIIPNNTLVKQGNSPYIILLNSDTIVSRGWDEKLISYLDERVLVTGYEGGILNEKGTGIKYVTGNKIDYICGWCMCFSRQTYDQFGLFDENLKFAYCEDSDFCLRIKEQGYQIFALHEKLVFHYGSKTANEVRRKIKLDDYIAVNHNYLRKKWRYYLLTKRILIKKTKLFN